LPGAMKQDAPLVRPPLQRMLHIHQVIQSGARPSAESLARQLEVSTKSVYRDLEFMRDRLGLPIEFCRGRKRGYYYSEAVHGFPSLQISEGELVALLVAEKALRQYRGSTFEKPLLSAFQKMAAALPETISLNLEQWGQTISFRTTVEPVVNLEVFDQLAKATARRQQLLLQYRKPGQRLAEARLVDPYHLANINGEWFLFAYCHLRKAIRTFVPSRIETVEATGASFERPGNFSLKRQLRDSFGVHSGAGEFRIRIRFHEEVADYIREKKWHPSQQLSERADGGVELGLVLSSLVEVQRWILGWGGAAVVLEPPELAASVRLAAERIIAASSAVRR
jgi:predicted DNA-binding transcriptional regulator YafY